MRIFLTGATGYIGSAVAKTLRGAGHDVDALVRRDADTGFLRELGVVLIAGELTSIPSLPLDEYDAFVHTAQSKQNTAEADRAAVDAFTAADGFFLYTSGVWVLGNNKDADEASDVNPLEIVKWRPPHEELVFGTGGAVLRPGCVYGGRQSLCASWFAAAEQKQAVRLVGDGTNRWAMVNIHDLAELYLRIVEQRTPGMLHGIDETNVTLGDCVRAVAPNTTIETMPLDVARTKLGAFADALAVDQRIASSATRKLTGWSPSRTFITSIEEQWREWRTSTGETSS